MRVPPRFQASAGVVARAVPGRSVTGGVAPGPPRRKKPEQSAGSWWSFIGFPAPLDRRPTERVGRPATRGSAIGFNGLLGSSAGLLG
jgi:hypothetical protein